MAGALNGQPLSSLLPPPAYDLPAAAGAHPPQEAMSPFPFESLGLIGDGHGILSFRDSVRKQFNERTMLGPRSRFVKKNVDFFQPPH